MVPPLKYQCEVRVPEKIGCEPQEREIGAGEVREGSWKRPDLMFRRIWEAGGVGRSIERHTWLGIV